MHFDLRLQKVTNPQILTKVLAEATNMSISEKSYENPKTVANPQIHRVDFESNSKKPQTQNPTQSFLVIWNVYDFAKKYMESHNGASAIIW